MNFKNEGMGMQKNTFGADPDHDWIQELLQLQDRTN